jgi:hypothetical protein
MEQARWRYQIISNLTMAAVAALFFFPRPSPRQELSSIAVFSTQAPVGSLRTRRAERLSRFVGCTSDVAMAEDRIGNANSGH